MNDTRKNLKVPAWVQKELKMFSAKEGVPMETIASAAIVTMLTLRQHKFTLKPKNKIK